MPVINEVVTAGSVRVDLVGGTIDLPPIHLILNDVVTMNLAASLKARVKISTIDQDYVEFDSKDYNSVTRFAKDEFSKENLYYNNHFKELTFVAQLLDLFGLHSKVRIELSSGAPAGSGLGGSSTMGVTLFKALAQYHGQSFSKIEIINRVRDVEGRILNSGIPGYQDYYPALYGGILALRPFPGEVEVDQLFSPQLKEHLENHLTLLFSGRSRLSGINNWEVYKAFFDKDQKVVDGLTAIAKISQEAYLATKTGDFDHLVELIAKEGSEREKLFPNIVSPEIRELFQDIKKVIPSLGLKVCGAGGGGCFLLTHKKNDRQLIADFVKKHNMQLLDFVIENAIDC